MANPKVIIGNEEWCAFPALGVPAIKARVDSGAKTSALHAFNIQRFQYDNSPWVSFDVHPLQDNRLIVVHCKAPVCDKRWVKSSSGMSEKRYVIKVPMQLGDFMWDVEVTLTNRDSMGYRMLLGRNAMQNHVLVDPSDGCYLGNLSSEEISRLYNNDAQPPSGLNIALVVNTVGHYSNQRIIETAQERGHNITVIDVNESALLFGQQQAQCLQNASLMQPFDIVIPRFSTNRANYACALMQHFQLQGAYMVNNAHATQQARDKICTLQTMQQYQVPVLLHGFAPTDLYVQELIEQVGGAPLLIKGLQDDADKFYVLAKTTSAAESIIHAMHSQGAAIMVQEYSKASSQRYIRNLVLHDTILASIEKPIKITASDKARKVLRSKEIQLTDNEQAMVIRAAQAMNLVLAGVDIIRTERGTLFYGISPNPSFEDIENTVDINIAQCLMRSLEDKFQHKVAHHE